MEFRPNLFGTTSFDGSLATTFKRAVTNIVCDNTLAAGLAERGQQVKIEHPRNSKLRLAEAHDVLNIIYDAADTFSAQVKQLCETTVTPVRWSSFLDEYAPIPPERGRSRTLTVNKCDSLLTFWRHDNRVAPWSGTEWSVLQAVNTHVHHEQTVRGASRVEHNYLRAVTGGVDDLDRETLQTLEKGFDRPVLNRAA